MAYKFLDSVGLAHVFDKIKALLAEKSDTNHTHNYAGSASVGGAANSANKLNTNAGNDSTPVYFKDGVPVDCTSAVHYTNDTPTLSSLGGVSAGTTFNNMTIQDVLTKILYPYTKPVASISVTPNGGTYEKGTTVTVTALKVTATKKSSDIAKVEAKQGSTVLKSITSGVASGGTFDCLPSGGISVTANTSFSGVVTDVDNGSNSASGGNFTFVDPYYYGVVQPGTTITSNVIKALTKDVKSKGAKTYSYTTNQECMVIAYPASYGELKSALDPNSFENIASFTKHEVTVACQSGNVAYYAYVKTVSTATDFAIRFSY